MLEFITSPNMLYLPNIGSCLRGDDLVDILIEDVEAPKSKPREVEGALFNGDRPGDFG